MRTNTGGDEGNRSRYWVSGEAHTQNQSGGASWREKAPTGK